MRWRHWGIVAGVAVGVYALAWTESFLRGYYNLFPSPSVISVAKDVEYCERGEIFRSSSKSVREEIVREVDVERDRR